MLTPRDQYTYFAGLENQIKSGLAFYLVIFICSTAVAYLGVERTGHLLKDGQTGIPIAVGLAVFMLPFGLLYVIGKIGGLGNLHIWLDKSFFGFLNRSNEIIFRELLSALDPDEQQPVTNFAPGERGDLAKTIFSRLAGDNYLFQTLLRSGIFRYWIWYWIAIYGTFLFTILAGESFYCAVRLHDSYSRTFFTVNWSLALLHLTVTVSLGYYLTRITRRTVDAIVRVRRPEIIGMLRAKLSKFRPQNETFTL